jgi:eukaryotic-like serine/threonine-protein kinase
LAVALFIARQTLIALEFAHHARDERGVALGLVHRDVSPENILVARNGEVKLTDFGIVRTRASSRSTLPGGLKGKLGYMSPEQIAGAELDPRSDLFSLGIVLAEMLTHAPLFRGLDELELLTRMYQVDIASLLSEELSRELRAVLTRALAPDTSARFQSAREFQDALEEVARTSGLELDVRQIEEWFSEIGIFPRQSGTFRVAGSSAPDNFELLKRIGSAREVFASSGVANSNAVHFFDVPGRTEGPRRALRETPNRGTAAYVPDARDIVGEARARAAAFCFGPTAAASEWSSPLRRVELAAVLCELVVGRRTGLLQACNGMNEKRLYFADGALVFIASTQPEELLGRRLIAEGLLRSRDVERALDSALRRRCRLGEALVADGLLPAHVVLRAVIAQLKTRFFELGSWHEGSLAFFDGEEPGVSGIRVQTAPLDLVFDLVRGAYSVAELRRLLSPIAHQPLERTSPLEGDLAHLPFSNLERCVIGAVDGRSSLNALVAGLAATDQVSPTDAYRAVFLAISSGALVSPSAGTALPVAVGGLAPSARLRLAGMRVRGQL